MAQQSEEKTLPASEKKLKDARRKGQVPFGKDLVSAVVFVAATAQLLWSWQGIADELRSLVDIVSTAVLRPFAEAGGTAVAHAGGLVIRVVLPLAAVTAAAAVLAGMLATFGPVMSFEPLAPKLERINPIAGLKRMFSLRSLSEIVKSVVKLAVVAVAFWQLLSMVLAPLFAAPACGAACFGPILVISIKLLAGFIAAVLVVAGLIDILVQRRLFLREMRMTRTERKREHKDTEGDPLVRREQRQLRRELGTQPGRFGLRSAVIVIADGEHLVGLRYDAVECPVPLVVCKGRDRVAEELRHQARRLAIPVIEDAALAAALHGHPVGQAIRSEHFDRVAWALFGAGLGKG
jgi:type III secretion protein U